MKIVLISCVFLICLILALLAEMLPFLKSVKAITIITKNSINTIKSVKMADAEKEKRLLSNSWEILWRSFYILGLVLIMFIAGYLLIIFIDLFGIYHQPVILTYLETKQGMLVSAGAFLAYFLLKKLYERVRL
jgi:hypothetical protein